MDKFCTLLTEGEDDMKGQNFSALQLAGKKESLSTQYLRGKTIFWFSEVGNVLKCFQIKTFFFDLQILYID